MPPDQGLSSRPHRTWSVVFRGALLSVAVLLRGEEHAAQGANELRAGFLKLPDVPCGEGGEQLFTVRRHAQQNAAMVSRVGAAADEALVDGAIDQFDRAVVLEQHARGDVGDGGIEFLGHAPHALQQLILLRAQAGGLSGDRGEMKKFSELEAELRETPHLRTGERNRFGGSGLFVAVAREGKNS
jgi:hypothetical protein